MKEEGKSFESSKPEGFDSRKSVLDQATELSQKIGSKPNNQETQEEAERENFRIDSERGAIERAREALSADSSEHYPSTGDYRAGWEGVARDAEENINVLTKGRGDRISKTENIARFGFAKSGLDTKNRIARFDKKKTIKKRLLSFFKK